MDNAEGTGGNSAPVLTSSPAPQTQNDERTFRQSEVNDLIGKAKSEAVERYKRETAMSTHTPNTQPQTQNYAPAPQTQYAPPVQQQPNYAPNPEEIRRMAAEEAQRFMTERMQDAQRNAEEQDAQRIAGEFFQKVEAGKAEIPDYDKVMSEIDLRSIPFHVQLANMVDNTAQVMYELGTNPSKIGAIQNLIDIDLRAGRQPKLALMEIKRLSESIKQNAQAKSYKAPNKPLSQMPPSTAGVGAMGTRAPGDYKRDPRYRV